MNILFEMGNERSEKNVNVVHIKQYADVLTEVGRKFHNTNIAGPCKVIARQAHKIRHGPRRRTLPCPYPQVQGPDSLEKNRPEPMGQEERRHFRQAHHVVQET